MLQKRILGIILLYGLVCGMVVIMGGELDCCNILFWWWLLDGLV